MPAEIAVVILVTVAVAVSTAHSALYSRGYIASSTVVCEQKVVQFQSENESIFKQFRVEKQSIFK
jgi:hypothetical protein